MLSECYNAILEEKDHPAMAPFDEIAVLDDLEKIFGKRQDQYFGEDVDESPFFVQYRKRGKW